MLYPSLRVLTTRLQHMTITATYKTVQADELAPTSAGYWNTSPSSIVKEPQFPWARVEQPAPGQLAVEDGQTFVLFLVIFFCLDDYF